MWCAVERCGVAVFVYLQKCKPEWGHIKFDFIGVPTLLDRGHQSRTDLYVSSSHAMSSKIKNEHRRRCYLKVLAYVAQYTKLLQDEQCLEPNVIGILQHIK